MIVYLVPAGEINSDLPVTDSGGGRLLGSGVDLPQSGFGFLVRRRATDHPHFPSSQWGSKVIFVIGWTSQMTGMSGLNVEGPGGVP